MTEQGMRPNSRDRAKLNFGSMSFNDFRPRRHHQTKDPPKTFENDQLSVIKQTRYGKTYITLYKKVDDALDLALN